MVLTASTPQESRFGLFCWWSMNYRSMWGELEILSMAAILYLPPHYPYSLINWLLYCFTLLYNRRIPKNMILAGLWFHSKKPAMHMYLKPIFDMLLDLEKTGCRALISYITLCMVCLYYEIFYWLCVCIGVVVDVPGVANPFVTTAHIICCTCDLPGKVLVQNILQFNSVYECSFCEQPGKNLRTENNGNVRIFPYQTESPKGEPRTADACLQYVKEAVETDSMVKTMIVFVLL